MILFTPKKFGRAPRQTARPGYYVWDSIDSQNTVSLAQSHRAEIGVIGGLELDIISDCSIEQEMKGHSICKWNEDASREINCCTESNQTYSTDGVQ
jgi:hypothetical protein